MGAEAPQGRGPRASINVTPLVDVVLVLLIIFMLVAPVLNESLALTPASRRPSPELVDEPRIVLEVQAGGAILLNGETVARDAVPTLVAGHLRGAPDRPVFFRVDDEVSIRDAVQVMDLARGAGARTLATVISE